MDFTTEHRHSTPNQSHTPFFQKKGRGESFFDGSMVQTKLTIGQPGDKYEQEADMMAEKVVSRSSMGASSPGVQSKCAECESEESGAVLTKLQRMGEEEEEMQMKVQRMGEEEEEMQMKVQRMGEEEEEMQMKPELQMRGNVGDSPEGFVDEDEMALNQPTQLKEAGVPNEASPDLAAKLEQQGGSGNPLPPTVQRDMGSAFGADFSGVKVHTDNAAVQMNKDLNAQAFTHGSDVYFNSGKYDTGSSDGQKLLAHELTHVVQQGAAG